MSRVDQLQYLGWGLYLVIFGVVLVRAIRRPTRPHINVAVFFGAVAVIMVVSIASRLGLVSGGGISSDLSAAAILSIGYLLMRLVADFMDVPWLLMRAAELGAALSFVAVLVLRPLPAGVVVIIIAYLGAVISYDAWSFVTQARKARGVTRRRMEAAAIASGCVALAVVSAGIGQTARADLSALWNELSLLGGMGSAIGYFAAFAPPTWLRRAWQEPEVFAFLARTVNLVGLADPAEITRQIELAAADTFGATAALVALWDADQDALYADGKLLPSSLAAAWHEQRADLIQVAFTSDHGDFATGELLHARAALLAPISTLERRIGLLVVLSRRMPIFANSDLELIQLLADQTAVILESKALLEESARVRAREETARLKEDFLSSAAHDLKTPVAGILTQAEVMQRRAQRNPTAPADRVGLDRLLEQSRRLRKLVVELMDVSRLEQGALVGEREPVDLTEMLQARMLHERQRWERVSLFSEGPVIACVDPPRFEQVVNNLVENALKYSPPDTAVSVRLGSENGEAHLSVQDHGIGIPVEDQPLVFQRFHRARNVDDRTFAGMGLGLYIARQIVEQHGGRIWVASKAGQGSTFYVTVPLAVDAAGAPQPAAEKVLG